MPPDATSRNPRHTELLLDISQEISDKDSLDEVLFCLLEITTMESNAERGTLFLYDDTTHELFSRIAMGNLTEEIRIAPDTGIAGHVFSTGESLIIDDAYDDERFNKEIDANTGFTTRNILCVPIQTLEGDIIGVAQMLNKQGGPFSKTDQTHLENMTMKVAHELTTAYYIEKTQPFFLKKLKELWHALFGA
ncbi:GAF domain-containing protein [Terasakiella sp. SH-1]|uniref:GAF domain-containing protein n=1 Tax=Terasakiella sp. SH-1 TaxID=2560057 RepID=UPI001073AAEB|nr:GAF domain-containing protein [Terasakiella sp. SH-1]